jgi:hypothetical protein
MKLCVFQYIHKEQRTNLAAMPVSLFFVADAQEFYLFLCLFLRKRFLRLCVDILCLFFFFPLGIAVKKL